MLRAEIKKINLNQDDYIKKNNNISFKKKIAYFNDLLGYCIVTGAVQRWDGKQEIMLEALKLEQVIGQLDKTKKFEVVYNKKDKCIAVLTHYQNKTNEYYLKPFELITKAELYALAKDIKKKCISEDEEVGGIAKLTKKDLFEFVVDKMVTRAEIYALAKEIKEKCADRNEEVGGIVNLKKEELFRFVVKNLDCLQN